jgi:8-oxo-dGTP pyrophosphatase MutT (NUDIX family)
VKYRPLAPWQVLERKTLLSRRWLELYEDRVRLGNGRELAEFHVIDAPSWSSVLCLTAADEVVLVRQYRHGISRECWELPAGVIEPGEAPLTAAKRELGEETGYAAERWEPILSVATEPSRHTVYAHFFCAFDATPSVARDLDESEDIEVVCVPCRELVSLVESGRIIHGMHVGAIFYAAQRGFLTL